MSSSCVAHFFKTAHFGESLWSVAKEATFAYHAATHGQSFTSCDCIPKLVSKFFEFKFTNARTKCESLLLIALSG